MLLLIKLFLIIQPVVESFVPHPSATLKLVEAEIYGLERAKLIFASTFEMLKEYYLLKSPPNSIITIIGRPQSTGCPLQHGALRQHR